ncbi:hypothetical protein PRK78_001332 [Emydomyces testavorans]|uniref:Atos-like conserved domain-containing protein n=1 Tax=Emydomyces testavorans TaxID=2070801 RepID=A0AAF0DE72_9EURO|nr:hypothetical protein PRK78_001332 [Emydomyces testavorans]
MPILHAPGRQKDGIYQPWSHDHSRRRIQRPADMALGESIEGLQDEVMTDITSRDSNTEAQNRSTLHTSNREELIQSIKRGESPTWVPSRSLEEYFAVHGDTPQTRLEELQKREKQPALPQDEEILGSPKRCSSSEGGSGLSTDPPIEIERPRSALHSGDFCEGSSDVSAKPQLGHLDSHPSHHILSTSPPVPWFLNEPQSEPKPLPFEEQSSPMSVTSAARSFGRLRAPSLGSFPANYVLKVPTSPLVYQANNPDLDMSHSIDPLELSPCSEKANRRRTLPPEIFQASPRNHGWGHSYGTSSGLHHREGLFSYQQHRPRKSLTSGLTLQPASPQNPFTRARRPSQPSEAGPLYHASMVGSFEESILRGRMSMSPSKPLDFTAQVGVLGRGNCKSNLKCPPHVTVSFPAVFYSYPTSGGGRTISDDSPSPYVGYIDIENSFPNEVRAPKKSPRQIIIPPKCPCPHHANEERVSKQLPSLQHERRAREKRSRRRSQSPKSPPGGCYRIPQQGQLQIVIKNPNKTAVKLFLVPYDLEGMEPGTKTFVRQRSYSTGPAVDTPLSAGTNTSINATETSQHPHDTIDDKPVLRYLVHFNICCPSKGRYYLYSGIRVVFANRVPDGKEKLRNEVHYPEPRYSPYKPAKDMSNGTMKLGSESALRRRSAGLGFGAQPPLDLVDFGAAEAKPFKFPAQVPPPEQSPTPSPLTGRSSSAVMREMAMPADPDGMLPNRYLFAPHDLRPLEDLSFAPLQSVIPQPLADIPSSGAEEETYNKLSKGDAGYGGHTPMLSPNPGLSGVESLLAQKLRKYNTVKHELQTPEDI